jgi:hypothetical protein
MLIFRHIFFSNYWWQKSDIWSQASYRYLISWEAFLDPSDSYFLFADFVDFYTHLTYFCISGLYINVCPIPVKTDVGQVDLVLRLSNGTREKKIKIPKRAGTTDKSISTGIKYWVYCIKEPCLISNLSIIYFD